jgi:2-oxoglutarate dehydrogenase E2 component (dihydrolipoamide succinyltransferase)
MAKIELALPAMGEGIIEATIIKWLVNEGDAVEEDQSLLEIATDKVDSEIPSPAKGIISEIRFPEGGNPSVGDVLVVIETNTDDQDPDAPDTGERSIGREVDHDPAIPGNKVRQQVETVKETEKMDNDNMAGIPRQTPSGKFLTPLVRSIAKKENITIEELESISGSGDGGRINKEDILKFIESHRETPGKNDDTGNGDVTEESAADKTTSGPGNGRQMTVEYESLRKSSKPPLTPAGEGDMVIEMDRMRKLIAEHMINSKQTSAHVTTFIDADVTEIVRWREANNIEFQKREGQKITYTPVFIEAVAGALGDYPRVNVSVDGTTIIIKKNINIGMAVALPEGNLIVPVIKNADEKSLTGLIKAVNDLAHRARIGKLQPGEITGGTFTITNFGAFRNTTGTPIINQPEVAILGIGAIIKKPVVLETIHGDVIAIRHIMTLSLSFDHRVVDGALGGMFLRRIAENMEKFDQERKI